MTLAEIREFRKTLRILEREVELSLSFETGCCGVTLAQCHLLLEACERDRTSITELSEILELDKSTLSRTVDGMINAGFLSRETDPANRRQQIIKLTGQGKEKADSIHAICDESYQKLFDYIPEDKKTMVIETAAILADAMVKKRKSSKPNGCCIPEKEEVL